VRCVGFLLISAACLFNQVVSSQTLSAKIDALIEQELPHATVGVLIKNAQTGDIIYSRNADKLLSPASSTKLFTAAAALYQLTPSFHFTTTLSQKNQDYFIKFTGSPSLTEQNLIDLVLNLKKNNIKTIKGNIVLDTTKYKPPYYPGGNSYDDLGWYYTAPDTAVILNENAVSFELISAKKTGLPVQIKAKTNAKALRLINQVVTVSKEEEKDHCNLNLEIKENNTIRLFGCMAQDNKAKLIELAIPDPVLFAKQVIKKELDKNKIVLKGQIINGSSPSDAQIIASIQSKNLTRLITHMLRESDNLYANSLTKQLAYSLTGNGTHKEGAFAIKKILSQHTHLDMTQLELTDGEGTRYNKATPEQIVVLLSDLYHDKKMQKILLNALPQAGVSGTLLDRMKKTLLEKNVFAKTGTMHDVSSLSGFLINPNAKTLIFSIMINGVNKPISIAKSLEEKILLAVDESELEH